MRFFTKGKYSHCEIAILKIRVEGHYDYQEWFECYSASPHDNGVCCKKINVSGRLKWVIELNGIDERQIQAYFERTQGQQYDFWDAIY